jgi:hypothetical protein
VSRLRFAASGKPEGVRLPSALAPLAWLVYVVAMTAYIYAFVHRPEPDQAHEVGAAELAIIASVALLHVALGFVIGPLAILAPLLPIVIAIPAGDYPGGWPEGPVWSGILLQEMFIGLPLIALGIGIRAIADRRMQPRDTQVDWANRLGRERRS